MSGHRFMIGVYCLVLLLLAASYVTADDPFGGVPWPSHTKWTMYRTGVDWRLLRPAVPADSVETPFVALPLPEGTEVYVPSLVPGRSPEAEQDSRNRSTSK